MMWFLGEVERVLPWTAEASAGVGSEASNETERFKKPETPKTA